MLVVHLEIFEFEARRDDTSDERVPRWTRERFRFLPIPCRHDRLKRRVFPLPEPNRAIWVVCRLLGITDPQLEIVPLMMHPQFFGPNPVERRTGAGGQQIVDGSQKRALARITRRQCRRSNFDGRPPGFAIPTAFRMWNELEAIDQGLHVRIDHAQIAR